MVERKNSALKEMVSSMLSYSGLSKGFRGEAMLTACYLLNRVPNRRIKTTPYEFGEKSINCIFVGYVEHSKAYRVYIIEPNDSVSINLIIESRDAISDENRFFLIPRPKDIIPNSDESQRDTHYDDVPSEIPEPRKGKRVQKAKSYSSYFQLYLVKGSKDQVGLQYSYCYSIEEDPRTYNEAMQSQDYAFWKEAIDDEISSIMENNTWVLSDLPPGCKPLGCKWIFKRKMKVDGTINKFKARLFSMKDIGDADVILGIKIKHENKEIVITQSNYIKKILKKFNREDCSPVSTPMDPVEKLKPNTVDRLSRFTSNPSRQHWQEITKVFKYLKDTMNYGLSYIGYPSVLKAYSDASWINHVEDSSSTSGWAFLLGGGAISWASKKQTCIVCSTMEFDFIVLAAGKEAEWLRNLIHEILIWPKPIA
uniref:Zinc finger, CCHC-type n=1 Tax=Tanacetum cinerariifolium TaxID=118510 RepID=A0A699IMN1_TANCI|nr:zinc finger, CCHC-type [Tanacetum cinerariifolium]